MIRNLLIPCSGPGTRSAGYTKFHKTLNRIGNCAVIDHIIASYTDIDTIYVTLGYQGDLVREYLTHAGYTNIEYIEIDNWSEGQIASFKQIPEYVFDNPLYYNACDNWSTSVPVVDDNTFFTCAPENSTHYDTDDDLVYSGISFMRDSTDYYQAIRSATHNRNDLLLMKELSSLQHLALEDWYDVGNRESNSNTKLNFKEDFSVLDKTHQEVYKVNNRIVKLFDLATDINVHNNTFPHPQPVLKTSNALSYPYANGTVNPYGDDFLKLLDNLRRLWKYSLTNNAPVFTRELWQDKTWQRFEMMCQLDEKYADVITIDGVDVDCTKVVESIDWDILNTGTLGPCHGDLTVDNIVVSDTNIYYIDHRQGKVNDVFYDVCKFYQSLHVHSNNLANLVAGKDFITRDDAARLELFRDSDVYKNNKHKIELGVGCLWLCMAPLNVDSQLNHQLFTWAMKHLYYHSAN